MTSDFKKLPDLERAICRVYYKKCTVFEFIVMVKAFQKYLFEFFFKIMKS